MGKERGEVPGVGERYFEKCCASGAPLFCDCPGNLYYENQVAGLVWCFSLTSSWAKLV